jgi:hypothetical protein
LKTRKKTKMEGMQQEEEQVVEVAFKKAGGARKLKTRLRKKTIEVEQEEQGAEAEAEENEDEPLGYEFAAAHEIYFLICPPLHTTHLAN